MAYTIALSPAAERQLRALVKTLRDRIIARLLALQQEPRPPDVKKLSDDTYRIRVGEFRIIYDISDQTLTVLVLTVGHRRDVYRRRHGGGA
jgi:mRNA interferase RelE/StbE